MCSAAAAVLVEAVTVTVDPEAAFTELRAIDLDVADEATCRRALVLAAQVEACVAAVKVRCARRARQLHETEGSHRPEVILGRTFGKTEASKLTKRSHALEAVPTFEAALQDGAITAAHADALTAAVAQTPAVADHQEQLVEAAATMGPDEFRHMCTRAAVLLSDDAGVSIFEKQRAASVVKRWVDKVSGMYVLRAELDPERGAQVWAAIDTHIEHQFHSGASPDLSNDQRAAVALHALATTGGSNGGVRSVVHVHVDLDTLRSGLHETSHVDVDGGGTLPVETIRRMACDADIIPHVLDGNGVALDQGRAKRLATHHQRQALRAMHPTCAAPGCRVAFAHTKVHHLTAWEVGGATDLGNLVPVCERHHHDLHEGGWQLALDPATRAVTMTRPDGPP